MGKNLIQQARGKGGPRYRAPSFRWKGKTTLVKDTKDLKGEIIDLIKCQGHTAPLATIKYENGELILVQAPEGIRVGDQVAAGTNADISDGNTLHLKDIPEGTAVYNIEAQPGDGGKFVRSSGTFAKIVAKSENSVKLILPSKATKNFHGDCRACIGTIAGSGRKEKPYLKAGIKFFATKARNKLWPRSGGTAMNSVDHPFGGKSTKSKGRPTQSGRNYPPGRKVGKIAPRRTGKKR